MIGEDESVRKSIDVSEYVGTVSALRMVSTKKYNKAVYFFVWLGQTVEKPRVQPGKTVPRELPRDSFSRLSEAFPQLVRLC